MAIGLVGQKLAGFTGIASAVKAAVEGALTRILTPKRSIDILREIAAAKAKGRPYTIVFVGVNGVGKSTNLAKVAYWLLQNNISVGLPIAPSLDLAGLPEHVPVVSCQCTALPVQSYQPMMCIFAGLAAQVRVHVPGTHISCQRQHDVQARRHCAGHKRSPVCDARSAGIKQQRHQRWLAQVMIAACDTFRSGAVEQLKTHCVRLGVPLYERGYEKDPAKVALEGQRAAERNKKDVLLVDTAGQPLRRPATDCLASLPQLHAC